MRFRLAFWMHDHPHAQPGDVVDVPDHQVDALVRAGIGHPDDGPEPVVPALEPAEPATASNTADAPAQQPE